MDCSKTINFLYELKRLCDSRIDCVADATNKGRCPMFGYCVDTPTKIDIEDATRVTEIVQRWSDKQPKKTYAQDFFERFPKAQSGSDGTPFVCRKTIYGEVPPKDERCDRRGACKNCWNEPMEE